MRVRALIQLRVDVFGSNSWRIVYDFEPLELLKSESAFLFFFRLCVLWDGAGVQRVRTQLWDQVTCFLT